MNWLLVSVVLSIVLTVGLNVALRALPNSTDRVARRFDSMTNDGPRVRVFFPWKAMLIGSIALTVLVNVVAALAR